MGSPNTISSFSAVSAVIDTEPFIRPFICFLDRPVRLARSAWDIWLFSSASAIVSPGGEIQSGFIFFLIGAKLSSFLCNKNDIHQVEFGQHLFTYQVSKNLAPALFQLLGLYELPSSQRPGTLPDPSREPATRNLPMSRFILPEITISLVFTLAAPC
jgi:hypothetical protein